MTCPKYLTWSCSGCALEIVKEIVIGPNEYADMYCGLCYQIMEKGTK